MKTRTVGLSIATAFALVLATQAALGQSEPRTHLEGDTPEGLDPEHFQCYEPAGTTAVRHEENITVNLRDQFGRHADVRVLRVAFICAPVSKNGALVADRQTHLVCYIVRGGATADQEVRTRNQFGRLTFTAGQSRLLCVPSLKRQVDEPQ